MIHGLGKGFGWIGSNHTLSDWTLGCIAVTNAEIEEIWKAVPDGTVVEKHPKRTLTVTRSLRAASSYSSAEVPVRKKSSRGRRPCRPARRSARRPVPTNVNRPGICADLY